MKIIYNIADRLDIQKYKLGNIEGYSGYLFIDDKVIRIRQDGTFEFV